MATVDYDKLAGELLREVGGEQNVASVVHCATRLRFKLKDEDIAKVDAIEALPGVITVRKAGGQFQVVIGNNVPKVYAGLGKLTNLTTDTAGADEGPKGSLLSRFIELISSIFTPILWPLAGLGLFKAGLVLVTTLGWLSTNGSTYTILNAAADGLFYFLPMFLAITAAKRFKTNQFTSLALAAALVYPAIVSLADTADVTFLGIPVVMMTYTSSVIPIIVAVWLQGYLERFLDKILPNWLRNFSTPLLVLLIMVPLVLITVGPITMTLANWISAGLGFLMSTVPWLGGAVMGGLWQVFVIFGMHWGFVPIMINDYGTQGYSYLPTPLMAAVLAQSGATLAVLIRSRSAKRREVAGPAAVSAFIAGVTEPAIYGVNLPLKRPFLFGIVGGAIGGAIAMLGGAASSSFVFPSLLAFPAFLSHGGFGWLAAGSGIAAAIGFLLTLFFGPREELDDADTAPAATHATAASGEDAVASVTTASTLGALDIAAPAIGRVIPLTDVDDKVFSSGAMGPGFGIVPANGRFVSPVSGTIVVAMSSGHAYGIKTDDGVELLVHIGLDTVELGGKHFEAKVSKGQRVTRGDLLALVDLDAIKAAGYDTTTVVIITNAAQLGEVTPASPGEIEAGSPAMAVTV